MTRLTRPMVRSPISLPSTPSQLLHSASLSSSPSSPSLVQQSHSYHGDYFSIKPKLSLDLAHSSDNFSDESELENNSTSFVDDDDIVKVRETFDNISIDIGASNPFAQNKHQWSYSPITPYDIVDENPTIILSTPKTNSQLLYTTTSPQLPRKETLSLKFVPSTLKSTVSTSTSTSTSTGTNTETKTVTTAAKSTNFTLSMPNLQQHKFLLVDDNLINLKILNRILLKLYPKAQITQVLDSTKVAKLVEENEYDAVFIDIEMPVVNGVQIAQFIRSDVSKDNLTVIAVTTKNSKEDLALFEKTGIDYTFGKPLNYKLDFMANVIDEIIERRKGQMIKKSVSSVESGVSLCSKESTNTLLIA